MSSDWLNVSVQELGKVITGKTPKSAVPAFWGNAVPFVTPYDFENKKKIRVTKRHISQAGADSVKNCVLPRRAVMVTCIGSDLGNVAMSESTCVTNQQINSIVVDENKFSPDFIYYALSLRKKDFQALAGGSAVPILNKSTFQAIEITCPSLADQIDIARLLSSFDDSIEALQQQNSSLESIVQTLFRSWFVRFDPVHAKAAGLAPEAMSAELAELFPSEFEESELGLIPKGWHPARLNSILELAYGKALKADTRVYGDVPVYGSGGIVGWHNQALCHGPSVIVGRKGTVGSVYWESRPFFPIDTVFYVRTKKPLTYCYQLLKSLGLPEMNTDAAVPGLNRENAYRLVVPNAPDEIIEAFDNIASRLMGFADCNVREIQRWSELRDHLLPRLISGKLSLEEAQEAVEELIPA